ncbi:MAG: glycosyltransferase family 4 protein, partial [Phycisphaerae bacterium]
MKVALVAEWLDAWRGGAETSTLQFMHHLMDRGVELHVFTRSRPSSTPGLQVHTISGASMSRTRRSVTFAHRVERLLRADSFDVVHAISPCRYTDIYQPRGGTVAETIERNLALIHSRSAQRLKRYTNHL